MRDEAHSGSEGLAESWRAACARTEIRKELEAIYAECAAEIRERGPACWASGRCCNFRATGHLLYVTGLEAAYTVRGMRERAEAVEEHENTHALPVLNGAAIEAAKDAGGCPYQQANLCGAHPVRPLGCRVYFCDRSAQEWQHDLSERMLRRIRELHDRHGIEYRYGEWRGMLAQLV